MIAKLFFGLATYPDNVTRLIELRFVTVVTDLAISKDHKLLEIKVLPILIDILKSRSNSSTACTIDLQRLNLLTLFKPLDTINVNSGCKGFLIITFTSTPLKASAIS